MIRCREYRRTSSTVSSAAGVTSGGNDTDILPGRPAWAGTASWLWTLLVPRDVNQAAGPGIPGRRPGHSRAVGPVKCHRFGVQLMTCRSQPRPPAIGRRPQHRCGRRCCRSCLTWAGHPTRAGRCPTRRRSAGSRCPIPRRPTTTSSGPQASPATQPHTGPATQLQASPATQLQASPATQLQASPATQPQASSRMSGLADRTLAPRTCHQTAAGQASSPRYSRRRWPAPGRPGRSCRGPASRRGGTSGSSDR